MHYKQLLSILFFSLPFSICLFAQSNIAESFELRYLSKEENANGESDFRGPTSIFSTDQRIAYLNRYADIAKRFFDAPDLAHKVVADAEVMEKLQAIKPQPLPIVRKRILLEDWRWMGDKKHKRTKELNKLAAYVNSSVQVKTGMLVFEETADWTWDFPSQSWRFSLACKIKLPEPSSSIHIQLSDRGQIMGANVKLKPNSLSYTSIGETHEEKINLTPNNWHTVKFEFDLSAVKRKTNVGRYNVYIDDKLVVDFVPVERVVTKGVGYATNFSSIGYINRLHLTASAGVAIEEWWGVGYHLTGRETYPYTVETFLDETFEAIPDTHNWQHVDYDDRDWQSAQLPFAHGSERYAEERLLLRKTMTVESFEQAYLNLETLDPGGTVYINGQVAARVNNRHPQRIDISQFLKSGKNVIALEVDPFYLNEKVGEFMPHTSLDLSLGWFAGRASIDLVTPSHFQEVFAATKSIEKDKATLEVKAHLQNTDWLTFNGKIELLLTEWFPKSSEKIVARTEAPLTVGRTLAWKGLIEVPAPKLWTPENPILYQLQAILYNESNEPIDDFVLTTGIRTVSQEGGVFRLNGEVSMLNGAQVFGFRAPVEDMIRTHRCAPADWIIREILQIKKMNGNLLRTHVHGWEFPARGINDPRYAEYADQLGMMLLWCPTSWIRTGRGWGEIDFEGFPKYMKQVYNHPSIVMWEAANHTQSFKGKPVSESNEYCKAIYNTIYPTDQSRLISLNSFIFHFHYGNDAGTIDHEGNPITPAVEWTAPMVTRGNQDSPTGYQRNWSALRNWPNAYRKDFLESKERAYFNFEHQESMAQPNWNLAKGKPWYHLHSYEWNYDEATVGRRLQFDEWEASQAWQGFSAWEAIKKMRWLDYDGFSWCSLHGGPNSVTYKKPLIDFLGYAKIAWHTNKMAFQKTVAGSANVDMAYGPADMVEPIVIHWGVAKIINLTVKVINEQQKAVTTKSYERIALEAGRYAKKVDAFSIGDLPEGYYEIQYILTEVE